MNMRLWTFFLSFGISSLVFSKPAQILLLRHAEKPEVGSELSSQGWDRARALPNMFDRPEFQKYGMPVALYGMSPHKKGASVRSLQTLTFLSDKIKVSINKKFDRDQFKNLVSEIKKNPKYNGKMVVICWQHDGLESIANEFGLKNKLHWDGDIYDRVWSLTFSTDSKSVEFQDLPQKILPFDSQN